MRQQRREAAKKSARNRESQFLHRMLFLLSTRRKRTALYSIFDIFLEVNFVESRYNTKNRYMGTLVKSPRIDPRFTACFQLVIKPSAIHRFGVYAGQRIPANRKVIEYTGERISNREANRRDWGKYTYLFEAGPLLDLGRVRRWKRRGNYQP